MSRERKRQRERDGGGGGGGGYANLTILFIQRLFHTTATTLFPKGRYPDNDNGCVKCLRTTTDILRILPKTDSRPILRGTCSAYRLDRETDQDVFVSTTPLMPSLTLDKPWVLREGKGDGEGGCGGGGGGRVGGVGRSEGAWGGGGTRLSKKELLLLVGHRWFDGEASDIVHKVERGRGQLQTPNTRLRHPSFRKVPESGARSVGHLHTPSVAFRHLPPNSARFGSATEWVLLISAQLSTDTVSALRKVRVL